MTMVNHEAGIHHLCTRPHDMTGSWTEAPLTRKMPSPLVFLFNCICAYITTTYIHIICQVHLCMLILLFPWTRADYPTLVTWLMKTPTTIRMMCSWHAIFVSKLWPQLTGLGKCLCEAALQRQVYIWLPKAVKILESASQLQIELSAKTSKLREGKC